MSASTAARAATVLREPLAVPTGGVGVRRYVAEPADDGPDAEGAGEPAAVTFSLVIPETVPDSHPRGAEWPVQIQFASVADAMRVLALAKRAHDAEVTVAERVARKVLELVPGLGEHGDGQLREGNSERAEDRNLITVDEAARLFGCGRSTIFNLIGDGLPAVRRRGIGRRIVKDKAIVWMQSHAPRLNRTAKRLQKGGRRG